jgi:hypothetical protein
MFLVDRFLVGSGVAEASSAICRTSYIADSVVIVCIVLIELLMSIEFPHELDAGPLVYI